jgi:hypothetical protein
MVHSLLTALAVSPDNDNGAGYWQETSTRDTDNIRSLELCASIVHLFLESCSEWYVSVVFLTGQELGNWKA